VNQVPSVFARAGVRLVSTFALANLGPAMHPRISILGGAFTLLDGGGNKYPAPLKIVGNMPMMLAVIIGANPQKSQVYFEGKYDPEQGAPPTCFSDNGVAPSSRAQSPQSATCGECQWSRWGSAVSQITGKGIPACSSKKKLALMVIDDTSGLAYEMQIPPASLQNLAAYGAEIAQYSTPDGARKADVSDFVTALHFVAGKTGELNFKPFAWLDSVSRIEGTQGFSVALDAQGQPLPSSDGGQAIGMAIDEAWEKEVVHELVGMKDIPWTPVRLPAPVAGQGQLQSPYSPPVGVRPATPAPLFTTPALQHPAMAPVEQQGQEQTRRPRRVAPPATNVVQHPAAQVPAGQAETVPPFLRPRANTAASEILADKQGPGPNFGMAPAGPPPTGLKAAVDAAFSLKT